MGTFSKPFLRRPGCDLQTPLAQAATTRAPIRKVPSATATVTTILESVAWGWCRALAAEEGLACAH